MGSNISPIAHGEWSRAFTFGTDYVVRFNPHGDDFRKDELAAHYATTQLPIPRILEVGRAFDGFYAISDRAHGTFLDALDAHHLTAALPSLWSAIDHMRQADISATHGFGVWDARARAPHATWREALLGVAIDAPNSRTAGWRQRLEQSPTGAQPFDAALQRLVQLSARLPDARHLVHADLLNYNVLVEGDRVSAVLDWGAAMFGDWVFDIAWFVFWQSWYPAWSGIDFEAEALGYFTSKGVDLARFSERLRCCAIAIGLDNQAYCAFKGESRWPQLEHVAHRTIALSLAK